MHVFCDPPLPTALFDHGCQAGVCRLVHNAHDDPIIRATEVFVVTLFDINIFANVWPALMQLRRRNERFQENGTDSPRPTSCCVAGLGGSTMAGATHIGECQAE